MRALQIAILYLLLIACTVSTTDAQTVYITNTGKKYHRGSCQYLRKSKHAIAMTEAVNSGYTACSVCRPGTPKADTKPAQNTTPKEKSSESQPTQRINTIEDKEARTTQCTATTKGGTRCKRMTKSKSGRCFQHE